MSRFLLALLFSSAALARTYYDTSLTGGRIVDGTGNASFYGELAIRRRTDRTNSCEFAEYKEMVETEGLRSVGLAKGEFLKKMWHKQPSDASHIRRHR